MKFRHLAQVTAVMGASIVFAASANAQSADTSSGQLQEIVVTANRRAQNLQEVPVSVTAISEAQLKQDGISSTTAIANFTPGLQVVSPNTGTDNFYSIRGATQNDFAEHEESPVAVYIDGVYMSQAAGTSALLFDTANVQVLRGPQGTLFGRNATAGLVQYTSNAPTFERDGYAEVTYGNYNNIRLEGAASDAITDNLAVRLSIATEHMDPYLTNVLSQGNNPGNDNTKAGRLQFLFKPTEDIDATFNVHGTLTRNVAGFYKQLPTFSDPNNHGLATLIPTNIDELGTCPGCDLLGQKTPANYGFYEGQASIAGHNWESTMGATETIKYRFGPGLTLTSITDFTKYNKDYTEDSTSAAVPEATFWTHVNTSQFSQELHVDNGGAEPLRWVTGFYYLNMTGRYIEGDGSSPALSALIGATAINNEEYRYVIDTSSWSIFEQSEYDILPGLTGTIGGRWSQENKSLNMNQIELAGYTQNSPVSTLPGAVTTINSTTIGDLANIHKGDWSGKAALNYHVTDDIIPYVSWSKGIKAGGYNAALNDQLPNNGFAYHEEKLYDTEAGVKTEFFDHHLRVDADVFYYDYSGYQAFNTIGTTYYVTNNSAKMTGGELDAQLSPIKGLTIRNGLAVLNAQINGILLPDGNDATRKTAQAPRYNVTGSVDYDYEFEYGKVTIGTDYSWRSAFYFDILNDPASKQSPYFLQNAHVSYLDPEGNWEGRFYIDNMWDKQYLANTIAVAGQGWTQGVFGMPLQFGVRLSYHL